jgi:hypothetical protein
MANYLSGAASDPRAGQPKRPAANADPGIENAKQQPKQLPKQGTQTATQTTTNAEQAKAAQGQQKGRRQAATAEVRPAVTASDEKAPESVMAQSLLAPTPPQHGSPPVILEPFEE